MIEVDYIIGPDITEYFGALKLAKALEEHASGFKFNEITYPVYSSNTKIEFLTKVFVYPHIVQKLRKSDNLAHITFQDYAFLYPYAHKKKGNIIISCLDLIEPMHYQLNNWHVKRNMKYLPMADALVTISEYSKSQIIEYFGYPEEKIHVIPCAIDHDLYRPVKSDIRQKYNIPEEKFIILYVGSEQPRKNFDKILEALAILKKTVGNEFILIKVGGAGWKGAREKHLNMIQELHLQNDVIFTGFVPEEELPKYYSGADVFVFPSENEGFGLPPLEAMACGCPVITTKCTSLPEVVGNSAIYVHPFSQVDIAINIEKIIYNKNIKENFKLKGINQSQKFNWKMSSEKLIDVYLSTY